MPSDLEFHGKPIRIDGEMLNLTDMWKASSGDKTKAPAQWMRSATAEAFIDAVSVNVGKSHIELVLATRGGSRTGTWAHWQIGIAYAKYLSPEFHIWCNTIVRDHMERESAVHQAPLLLDATPATLSDISEVKGILLRHQQETKRIVESALYSVNGSLKKKFDNIFDYVEDFRASNQEAGKILRKQIAAVGTAVRTIEADLSRKVSEYAMVRTDWYDAHDIYYKIYGVGSDGVPRRAALTNALGRSLDSYCLRNKLNHCMAEWETGGEHRRLWHKEAVMPWYHATGCKMIEDHFARNPPKGDAA